MIGLDYQNKVSYYHVYNVVDTFAVCFYSSPRLLYYCEWQLSGSVTIASLETQIKIHITKFQLQFSVVHTHKFEALQYRPVQLPVQNSEVL